MSYANIRLDGAGMAAMLNSAEVERATREAAEAVAAHARTAETVQRHSVPVTVQRYIAKGGRLRSSRPGFAVTLDHYGGRRMEAKYGVLNRAAQAVNL